MKNKPKPMAGPQGRFLLHAAAFSALLAMPLPGFTAPAPAPGMKATAGIDKKLQKLVVSGKTIGMAAGSQVAIYDAADHRLLFAGQTDAKSAFKFVVQQDAIPCRVQLETTSAELAVAVTGKGVPKACKTKPACSIVGGNRFISASTSPQTFEIITKNQGLSFDWDMGDGTQETNKLSVPHTYKFAGLYLVTAQGHDASGGQCADAVTVSVAPPAGANPNPPVAESGARPKVGAGMPGVGGANDTNAYVVFPFEDTGMQGGSQVTQPYSSMTPYNALNAQILKKVARKPQIVTGGALSAFYSAASSPNDPSGANSINSTSQNWFGNGKVGANFDTANTTCYYNCTSLKTTTSLIDGQDYNDAVISKSEFWDRSYQAYAKDVINADGTKGQPQRGMSGWDQHNSFTPRKPMALPDEGLRGHVDNAAGVRKMPGWADPYKANAPQKLDFSGDQNSFVAQNIPVSDIDDQGRTNPYPIMRIEAKDSSGARVAATDAVLTSASETRCRECHIKGAIAADEAVWRTPVHESELATPDGKPGPATGEGSYLRSKTPATIKLTGNLVNDFKVFSYGAAVHNRFDEKHIEYEDGGNNAWLKPDGKTSPTNPTNDPTWTRQIFSSAPNGVVFEKDANGVRKDRVLESRWLKPDGSTSPTNPTNNATWKLQVRLKFKEAKDYGDDSWQNQEKAALFNTALMHDYMTKYYGQYSVGTTASNFGTGNATAFAEQAEEKGKSANGAMCAGHHTSQLKADIGAGAQAYQGSLSNFSGTMHAFHGKMQVYKEAVAKGADNKPHNKGELIRDERGHPLMFGGRGWDSMHFDDNNIRQKIAGTVLVDANDPRGVPAPGQTTDPRNQWDTAKNNWAPEVYPQHAQGELMLQFGSNVAMEDNCAKCHTGKTEKSYRDIHHAAGLKCDNCHSDMLAVGNAYANEKYDYNLTAGGKMGADKSTELTSVDFRRYWIDEPDCGSCHIGDANLKEGDDAGHGHKLKNVYSAGALKQAWMDGDKSGTSMFPMDARFAVMPHKEVRPEKTTATDADVAAGLKGLDGNVVKKGESFYKRQPLSQSLYRKSGDVHGSGAGGDLNCSTCHGASHAIWPNPDPNANDNVTANQLQGYDGHVVECSTCHIKDDFKTGLVATDGGTENLGVGQGVRAGSVVSPTNAKAYLAGPHGMHPVNDEYWYKHADGAALNTGPGSHRATMNGGWHNDMAGKPGPDGEDQCAACHGSDHKGTRLSRTLVARTFINHKGKPVKVAKEKVIGCDLCHSLKKSFANAPNPASPTGGWPKALRHMPPMPEAITGGSGGGGHM